jgi:hypothetical protein
MTRDISDFFEGAREGLTPVSFGEFLVDQGGLTRAQLYEALREQDRHPGIPLGEIVAYMGYLPYAEIDRLLTMWNQLPVVEVK